MSVTREEGKEAGRKAFEALQKELQDRGAGLHKIALRIKQGLNAKRTEFAKFQGKMGEQKNLIDFAERRKYASLAIQVFGASAPQQHIFPDKEGNPQDISGLSSLEAATRLAFLIEKAMERKKQGNGDTSTKD